MSECNNIAILSTVANFALYERTSPLFPSNIPRFVIDGQNGMHGLHSIFYMFKMLRGRGIEWLIMADEDVILINDQKVFDLLNYMKENGFKVCGVRDGGMIPHRSQNPYAINTFFSVLHFSEIENIYNKTIIKKNQYITSLEFKDDLGILNDKFSTESLFEPYYCFYFWLRRKGFKFLFLDAKMPFKEDDLTNSVHMPNGELLLYHTWYARAYEKNEKHTKRINRILKKIPSRTTEKVKPLIFKDRFFFLKETFRKTIRRIILRIKI